MSHARAQVHMDVDGFVASPMRSLVPSVGMDGEEVGSVSKLTGRRQHRCYEVVPCRRALDVRNGSVGMDGKEVGSVSELTGRRQHRWYEVVPCHRALDVRDGAAQVEKKGQVLPGRTGGCLR